MPHSGGGGSHGGGSHGGGGGGGRGGGSGHSYVGERSTPFKGSKRYSFVSSSTGKTVFFYSDRDFSSKKKSIITILLFFLPLYIVPFIFHFSTFATILHIPQQLPITDSHIYIHDTLDVIDEDKIMPTLEAYKEKTGITPAIVTIPNSEWAQDYSKFEYYAFDYYVYNLVNEDYALIVYSTDPERTDFNDWHYEIMLGDDTYGILDDTEMERLNKALYRNFNSRLSVTTAIQNAFKESEEHCMSLRFGEGASSLPLIISWFGFVTLLFVGAFRGLKPEVKGYNGEPITLVTDEMMEKMLNKPILHTCRYCGNSFDINIDLRCPTCGAKVSSEEIKQEKNNLNIKI